ncbi:hypothetical protein LCGC14_1099250 [marine sediment metagenome]|uniref:Uncharacterized protein n=1 Tax=marine sediment metagenome TaxID=412755 RepID=A0A0F9MXY9_9ZZZZ
MESLNKGDILRVEALTMTKGVFAQLRATRSHEVEGAFIGWVLADSGLAESFIGKAHGTLVRVRRSDIWEYIYPKDEAAQEAFKQEAERRSLSQSAYAQLKIDELRDSLPQIFLK